MFRVMLFSLSIILFVVQDPPPDQPHTNDPAKCTRYCYPKGYENLKPKGTPEGIPGYPCQGDHCAKAVEEGEENPCDEHGDHKCSTYCAKVCCTCLNICI